jgi:hypothetical protein
MPIAATAVLLILPATMGLIWSAFCENYVEPQRFFEVGPAVVIGIMISLPLLFWMAAIGPESASGVACSARCAD